MSSIASGVLHRHKSTECREPLLLRRLVEPHPLAGRHRRAHVAGRHTVDPHAARRAPRRPGGYSRACLLWPRRRRIRLTQRVAAMDAMLTIEPPPLANSVGITAHESEVHALEVDADHTSQLSSLRPSCLPAPRHDAGIVHEYVDAPESRRPQRRPPRSRPAPSRRPRPRAHLGRRARRDARPCQRRLSCRCRRRRRAHPPPRSERLPPARTRSRCR